MKPFVVIAVAIALGGCAQQAPAKPPTVIGVIVGVPPELGKPRIDALRGALETLGYREGRDITLEVRYLEGQGSERAAALTSELIQQKGAAVIITGNPEAVEGARKASSTVPIVLAGVGTDPVGSGWAASLARPDGNVTGISFQVPTINGRRLQIMRAIFPAPARVGLLLDATAPGTALTEHEEAARTLGFTIQAIVAREPSEIEAAFATFRSAGITSVSVAIGGSFSARFPQIASLALASGIATSWGSPDAARAGGLLALGPEQIDLYRRSAGYVDKILKGAKPGELPLAQPEIFDLVINMKTAAALGIKIPDAVLAQATEVIH